MSQELDLPARLEEWANGPMFLSDTPAVKAVLRIAAERIRELEGINDELLRAQPAGEARAPAKNEAQQWIAGENAGFEHHQPTHVREADLVQKRMRPTWEPDGRGWTQWEDCTDASALDCERTPINGGWQYEVRRLYAAPPAAANQAGIAEGYVLVPKEPTDRMTFVGQKHRYDSMWSIGAIYREMLAAAPHPTESHALGGGDDMKP